MENLIKRLEIIKNLISLEETDEIIAHLEKLKINPNFSLVCDIVQYVSMKQYSKANIEIGNLISKYRQVTLTEDPEIVGLRLDLKYLEKQITERSIEKATIEKDIHNFNQRYNKELGKLILQILENRKRNAISEKEKNEAETDYNSYNEQCQETEKTMIAKISEQDKLQLKKLYRKAASLCHPDKVSDDEKQMAQEIFVTLQKAYEQNDLPTVKKIMEQLENGEFFTSNSQTLTERNKLTSKINQLKNKLQNLKTEIQILTQTETYKTLSNIEDWDAYFIITKEQFKNQLGLLTKYATE